MGDEAGARARILVVDDSKLMRKAAHKMLGDEFDVVTADDGDQAWALLGEDPTIQVVFTDLNMPVCDGYELLRRVRTCDNESLCSLPVIVVTGAENDESARMRALDTGATDFITKPFTTVDLLARARAHVNNQRITRRLQAQSTIDSLTGLGNLAGFLERLQQDIAYARRHAKPLSVVRLEIVDFRRLFLYHGRAVADALVLQVARLLRARTRKEDSCGRIGLGGFGLSLPGGEVLGIEGMLARLREDLVAQPPVDEDGLPIPVVLASAVLGAEMLDGEGAKSLLSQCEARLAAPQQEIAQATAAVLVEPASAPLEVVAPAPAVAPPEPAPQPEPPAAVSPLLIDPLLEQLLAGNPRPLAEKLPQVIGRLLPLFRLLGPNQRAQLVQFLQRLG